MRMPINELIHVTEAGARAAAAWVGRGDKNAADDAAVEAMRATFANIPLAGTVVIGEGERDEAPMLYIGEELGAGGPEVDIAVDPLECTTPCAQDLPGAISIMALAPKGHLLHAPDTYMEKIACGIPGVIDITKDIAWNVHALAKALGKPVPELRVFMLDRKRNAHILAQVRELGCRVRLTEDGDLMAAVCTAIPENEIDLLLGSGGAPEGVIAAAALQNLGGEIQGRLLFRNTEERERAIAMGFSDPEATLTMEMLSKGDAAVIFTGITDGPLVRGVRREHGKTITETVVIFNNTLRKIEHRTSDT